MDIAKKTFLITGAGSGLGAQTAQTLVAGGGNVVLADLNRAAGEQLQATLGDSAIFVETDVTSGESGEAAVAAAKAKFGGLHGLINSFTNCININLIGTFNMLRLAAAAMMEGEPDQNGERGVIINTASIAAWEGQLGQAAYSASKSGILGLTLPAARELASSGIRVMAIAPGIFDTAMMAAMPENVRTSLAAMIPFPSRFGKPEEYAALARHIIENPMLNGDVIRIDGAVRMGAK